MPFPDPEAARRRPLRPEDFPDWTAYYWSYQYELVRSELVPRLDRWKVWTPGVRVLDVGCGDGGASCALCECGARVTGFDLEPRRVGMASERARARGLELGLGVADITDADTLGPWEGPFDLILFRDVLEHIPRIDLALENCVDRLAPGGSIVVIFPPYWSAYGGHQQILRGTGRRAPLAKLPFIHWTGTRFWGALAGPDEEWEEILTVRRSRLTVSGLRKRAARHGLEVRRASRFLLRPSFHLRYGTPVLGAGLLGQIPGLREILVTGSWELLGRADAD